MGVGYTRNDASDNIASGKTARAADLDGEFDALVDAFNGSTGHTHDGTSAEGGPVSVIGPVQDVIASASSLAPKTGSSYTLGTDAVRWSHGYMDELTAPVITGDVTGDVVGNVTGDLTGDVTGNVTGDVTGNLTGNVTGDLTGDVTGNVTGDLTGNVTGDVTGDLTGNVTGDVTGDVTGSAGSLNTARNIALSGDVTGSQSFDGSTNISIVTTVADNSHNHTLANISDAGTMSGQDSSNVTISGGTISVTSVDVGTLDVSSGMTIEDNVSLGFGTDDDFTWTFDGTDLTGVIPTGGEWRLVTTTGPYNSIRGFDNGGVILNYQSSERVKTTTDGVELTGDVTIDDKHVTTGWELAEVAYDSGVDGTQASVELSDFEDGYVYEIEIARLGHNSGSNRGIQVEIYGETAAAYTSAILLPAALTDPTNVHSSNIQASTVRTVRNHHSITMSGEAESAAAVTDFAGENSIDQRNIYAHYGTAQKILKLRFSWQSGSIDAGVIRVWRKS